MPAILIATFVLALCCWFTEPRGPSLGPTPKPQVLGHIDIPEI